MLLQVEVMQGSSLSQVDWGVKSITQQDGRLERLCGDELNTSSAFVVGFGRGLRYLKRLAGFGTFFSHS